MSSGMLRIGLKMEAMRTSETSVDFYETIRRKVAEDVYLQLLSSSAEESL
jgi:hypothetical protein